MPELRKSDAEQPQGVTLRDAQKRIAAMMGDGDDVNPKGKPSRLKQELAPEGDDAPATPRDLKGRFRAAPPADDADDTADDAVDSADDTGAEDEADDTPDQDVDRAQDDAEADDSGKAEDETPAAPIQTLAELAEALEIPLADLKKQLKHKFNAAGAEVEATLEDLERGYQMEQDYQRNKTKLSEERRAFEAAARQQAEKFVADSHALAAHYTATEQLLQAELNHPRMTQLRMTDPAEWTARYNETQQRLAQLGQARQYAAAQYQAFQAAQNAEIERRERARLAELVPSWGEDKRVLSRKTMESLGYDANEISNVLDARLIAGALELASLREEVKAFREAKAKADQAVQRLKKEVPKLAKPGKATNQTAPGLKKENVSKLRQRLRQSGSMRDAGTLIERMGILGS